MRTHPRQRHNKACLPCNSEARATPLLHRPVVWPQQKLAVGREQPRQ
ncbi:hypothetical protein [Azospirillum largimobile]